MGRLVLQREGSAGLASRFWMQVGTTKYTCSVAGTHPSPVTTPSCAQQNLERSRAPLPAGLPHADSTAATARALLGKCLGSM